MKQNKLKFYLDFLPLVILAVYAIVLIADVVQNDTGFLARHLIGLIFLLVNIALFVWNHQIGVLFLGLLLFFGLFGLLSFDYEIAIDTTYIGKDEESQIPIFFGQPMFILWVILHFIVSGRYYVGIVTRKYWAELSNTLTRKTD
jgi:hypothetical protein